MSDEKKAVKDPFQPTQAEIDEAWEEHVTRAMVIGNTHTAGRELVERLLRAERVAAAMRQRSTVILDQRLRRVEELAHEPANVVEPGDFLALEGRTHRMEEGWQELAKRIDRVDRDMNHRVDAVRGQVERLSQAIDLDMHDALKLAFAPSPLASADHGETATRTLHEVLRKKPYPSLPLRDRGATSPIRLDAKDDGLWCIIPNAAFNLMHLGPQQARNAAVETWEHLRGQPWNRHANEPLDVASEHGAEFKAPVVTEGWMRNALQNIVQPTIVRNLQEAREEARRGLGGDPRTDRDQT